MPLQIQYRPIALPPVTRPVREAGPVEAVSEFDRLKAAVLAERADKQRNRPHPFAFLGALARATSWRQRVAGIVAIGALGVTLGAIGWGSAGITPARAEVDVAGLEPFERAGQSFPGSAFYYLDPADSGLVAPRLAEKTWATQGDAPAELAANPMAQGFSAAGASVPIARPLTVSASGEDHYRAAQCLTAAIYYEAASEPDQGQRAVAQVVLNRVAHPAFPNTVCGVVYQGSERTTGCQFSFTCDGALARVPSRFFWSRARDVAASALSGYVEPSVGLATHYHTNAVHPYWAPSLHFITAIGAHRFYSLMGRAGDSGTFRFAFGGGEPVAAPHPHIAAADKLPDPALDPLALQRAYDSGFKTAQASGSPHADESPSALAQPGPAPRYSVEIQSRGGDRQYSGDKLPGSQPGTHGVKPEYQQSGNWIAQPGG